MEHVIQKHYSRLAGQYDDFLYYSPDFVRRLTSKMVEKLRLKPEDRLVDLGCGTGMYSLDILEQVPLREPVLGVDPFQEMLDQIPEGAAITPLALDALAFSERDETYDKALMKETVHHIEDRRRLFENVRRQLSPGGIFLLVHVPPDVQYPLFEAALERARGWHADPDELVRLLGETGYEVERDGLDYRHTIPKDKYFQMVRGCYMSVLSSFEPEEIARGVEEMEKKYADRTTLEFVDHFDYITARKR